MEELVQTDQLSIKSTLDLVTLPDDIKLYVVGEDRKLSDHLCGNTNHHKERNE